MEEPRAKSEWEARLMSNKEGLFIQTAGSQTFAPDWAALAGLNKKIAAVMGELEIVQEDAKHQQGWKYASYGAVVQGIRKSLSKHEVGLYANLIHHEQQSQGKGIKSVVEVEFTFADGETGALRTSRWAGEAMDFGVADKGLNKAYTAAEKYFLMRTFLVSTTDDVEPDATSQPRGRTGQNTTKKTRLEGKPPRQAAQPKESATEPTQRSSSEERDAIALSKMIYMRWNSLLPEDKNHDLFHREFQVATAKDLQGKVTAAEMIQLLNALDLAQQRTLTLQTFKELLGLTYLVDWFPSGYTYEDGLRMIGEYVDKQAQPDEAEPKQEDLLC